MRHLKNRHLIPTILSIILLTACGNSQTSEPTTSQSKPVKFSIESSINIQARLSNKSEILLRPSEPDNIKPGYLPNPEHHTKNQAPANEEDSNHPNITATQSTEEEIPTDTSYETQQQPPITNDHHPVHPEQETEPTQQPQEPAVSPSPSITESTTSAQPTENNLSLPYCGIGDQALIDSCYGLVRFSTYENVGFSPTYAIHWEHGGYQLPLNEGIIHIDNVGTFKLTHVVSTLSFYTNTTKDLPYGAAPVFFQTCLNGDNNQMIFIAAYPM